MRHAFCGDQRLSGRSRRDAFAADECSAIAFLMLISVRQESTLFQRCAPAPEPLIDRYLHLALLISDIDAPAPFACDARNASCMPPYSQTFLSDSRRG